MANDLWFERLAKEVETVPERAPAVLKSKVYSAIVARMSESGPLRDLSTTKRAGGHLCVFEHAVALLPIGTDLKSRNPCQVCHARVLAEQMDHAPIFWPGCPYSEFHNG